MGVVEGTAQAGGDTLLDLVALQVGHNWCTQRCCSTGRVWGVVQEAAQAGGDTLLDPVALQVWQDACHWYGPVVLQAGLGGAVVYRG